MVRDCVAYYMRSPTHLGLDKDSPTPRPVMFPSAGRVVAFPEVNGLHHRYVAWAHNLAASSLTSTAPTRHGDPRAGHSRVCRRAHGDTQHRRTIAFPFSTRVTPASFLTGTMTY